MRNVLTSRATLHDLRSAPREAEAFVRKVLGVMSTARRDHGVIVLRMGVTGTGQQPNYRLEDTNGAALIAIDGANHQPWPQGTKFGEPENWSEVTMSYDDVKSVLASITTRKT